MRRRHCVTRAWLVALGAIMVLLGLPGTTAAGGELRGPGTETSTDDVLLARGSGYGDPSTSLKVRAVQRALRKLGWQPGPVDGLFGPRTEAAVMRIQRAAGLAPDGILGPRTGGAIESALRKPLRQGMGYYEPDGSPRVRTLQARLRGLGFEPGPVDGVFGPRTQAGVKRLQRAGGVSADGIVGSGTRHLLADGASAPGKQLAGTQPAARHDPSRRGHGERAQARSDSRGDLRIRRSGELESSVATEDAAQDSGGLDARLVVAGTALALVLAVVIDVLLWLLGQSLAPTPLTHGGVPAGRLRLRSIVRFRGRVDALVPGRGRLGHRREPRHSISDPPLEASREPHRARRAPMWSPRRLSPPAPPGRGSTGSDSVLALGYVSVPDGHSLRDPWLKAQREAIDSLCNRRGWTLLEVVHDYEEPRGKALERPGLGYALERLERGEASCLVVSELQRLSRSVADLGRTLQTIGRSRARLVALDVGIDTGAPEGRKAASVLVAVSAWERDRLAERTRKGLEAARAGGGPVSRPSVHDMPALKEWIIELRESGLTLQAIADRLNEEGVPTLRGGAKWRPSSVQTAAGYRRPRGRARDAGRRSANGGTAG